MSAAGWTGPSVPGVSWQFVVRPKWIVRHVAVVALVVTMVLLGLWQLRRLDDKRAYRDLVEQRQEEPPADVRDVVPTDGAVGSARVEAALYRKVAATGTYEAADTVVVDNRTLNGAAGGWVLTPLRLDDGTAVVVNRGFVGFDRDGDLVAPDPPAGRVEVGGLVLPSQRRGGIGPTDAAEGRLEVLARADLERLAAQVDYALLPAYVQLVTSDPPEPEAAGDAPALVPLGAPEPSEGPHLAYAVQWFTFTTIAAGGYLLLLRRVARDEGLTPCR